MLQPTKSQLKAVKSLRLKQQLRMLPRTSHLRQKQPKTPYRPMTQPSLRKQQKLSPKKLL
jgi:hypothetical protein